MRFLKKKQILSNSVILCCELKNDAKLFIYDSFNELTGRLRSIFNLDFFTIQGNIPFKGSILKEFSVFLTYSGKVEYFSDAQLLLMLGIAIENNVKNIKNDFMLLCEDRYAASYNVSVEDGVQETQLDIVQAFGMDRNL